MQGVPTGMCRERVEMCRERVGMCRERVGMCRTWWGGEEQRE